MPNGLPDYLLASGVGAGAGAGAGIGATAGAGAGATAGAGVTALGAGAAGAGATLGASAGLTAAGAVAGVVVVAAGAAGVGVGVVEIAGAAGAGIAGAAGAVAAGGAVKSLSPLLALCFLEIREARITVTMKRAPASQPVPFCRTLVVWAPQTALVTPSPKDAPRPSCRGRCMRMMSTRSRQTITSTMVSNGIRMSIKGRGVWRQTADWQAEGLADAQFLVFREIDVQAGTVETVRCQIQNRIMEPSPDSILCPAYELPCSPPRSPAE